MKIQLPAATLHVLRSLLRFGIVGVGAVLVQAFLFLFLAKYLELSGFVANTLAFAVSLVISYFGQSRWTFSDRKERSVARFLTLAAVSFVLGSGGAWLVVDRWGYSAYWMFPAILILIPLASFLLMRGWVFTHSKAGSV